jgi:hypothetical protein
MCQRGGRCCRWLLVATWLGLVHTGQGNADATCLGRGGTDKILLGSQYSKGDLPARPVLVLLDFEIQEITDIDDIKNVSGNIVH